MTCGVVSAGPVAGAEAWCCAGWTWGAAMAGSSACVGASAGAVGAVGAYEAEGADGADDGVDGDESAGAWCCAGWAWGAAIAGPGACMARHSGAVGANGADGAD